MIYDGLLIVHSFQLFSVLNFSSTSPDTKKHQLLFGRLPFKRLIIFLFMSVDKNFMVSLSYLGNYEVRKGEARIIFRFKIRHCNELIFPCLVCKCSSQNIRRLFRSSPNEKRV